VKRKFDRVYQFKITLKDIAPPIWRRIQVPDIYTFWDLHVAIQDALGWLDYHLHEFEMKSPSKGRKVRIGIPDEDGFDRSIYPGWKLRISDYFAMDNKKARYLYDFGDGWEHNVVLEKILPRETGKQYPACIDGKRACPPEDCSGAHGYEHLLEVIMDPSHAEYQELIEWLGDDFEPERFQCEEVYFWDPQQRWKIAFE
jgi:hypothetical protein